MKHLLVSSASDGIQMILLEWPILGWVVALFWWGMTCYVIGWANRLERELREVKHGPRHKEETE